MNQNADLVGQGTSGNGGETPEFKTLLDRSMDELRAKTMGHQAGWRFGKAARWSLDMSRGDLLFTFDDGVVATCPAQIVGSLDNEGGTWLWGWANPSIPDELKMDSLRVREFGEQRQISRLTSEEWPCAGEEAWQMAALACKLCEAQGVYRGPAGSAFVFMTFRKVELSRKS
jgi:hypothetical protein